MTDHAAERENEIPREIDLLLFHAEGVHLAVDAIQVEGIISSEQAELRTIKVGSLSKLLGREGAVSNASSKVLLFRDGDETRGIGISGLDAIVPVEIGTIQPLPELLSSAAGWQPFWGVFPRGGEVVLLIDLFRLKSLISRRAEATA